MGPITIGVIVAQLVVVFGFLLVDRRRPTTTMAWLLAVLLIPVVGVGLYLLIGREPMRRRKFKRLETAQSRVEKVLERCRAWHPADWRAADDDARTRSLLALGNKVAETPATPGNRCGVLEDGNETYAAMMREMDQAKDHIHLESYIIQDDEVGRRFRDKLTDRAAAGIEVRVVYAAVGSLALPDSFWAPLVKAGGEFAVFNPLGPFSRFRRGDRINFRNHRKIMVVDGLVGFTGGMNIGNEYADGWRDAHLQLHGPAVLALQRAFAEDWLYASPKHGELSDSDRYFPEQPLLHPGDARVQVVDSAPDSPWSPIHRMLVQAIASATERVWLTSPYFIPSEVLEEAITSAALRAVDVQIIVPGENDLGLVAVAAAGYFEPLLEAGVHIHRYRGMVHAKTLVIDDWVTAVGSANMDMRSFRLNREVTAFVFDSAVCANVAELIEGYRENSDAVLLGPVPYWRRIARAGARLLSPLL